MNLIVFITRDLSHTIPFTFYTDIMSRAACQNRCGGRGAVWYRSQSPAQQQRGNWRKTTSKRQTDTYLRVVTAHWCSPTSIVCANTNCSGYFLGQMTSIHFLSNFSSDQRPEHQGTGPAREVQETQPEKGEGLCWRNPALATGLQTQGVFGPAS